MNDLLVCIPDSFLEQKDSVLDRTQGQPSKAWPKVLFIVGYLSRKVLQEENQKKRAGFIPIHSGDMQKLLGEQPVKNVITPLIQEGVIEVQKGKGLRSDKPTYIAGQRSISYRLVKRYRTELLESKYSIKTISEPFQSRRFFKWLQAHSKKAYKYFPSLEELLLRLDLLEVDREGLEGYMEELELAGVYKGKTLDLKQHEYLTKQIESFCSYISKNQESRFAKLSKGRIHNTLTNIPKLFREYIYTKNDGSSLEEVDMHSAQMVFLCKALLLYYQLGLKPETITDLKLHIGDAVDLFHPTCALPSDILPFINAVVNHDIYSFITDDMLSGSYSIENSSGYRLEKSQRDKMKTRAFERVFFTNNPNHPSEASGPRKKMYKEYPSVMEFVHHYNESALSKKRSRGLAILLQEMEGWFFNQELIPAFLEAFPDEGLFLVYDALYVPNNIHDEVIELADSVCEKYFGCKGLF